VEDTGGVISDVDLSEFDEDYDYEDPDSVDPDIAKETDAAFDALVDDDPPTNSQTFVDTAEHPEGHTYSVTLDDVSSSPPELSVLSQAYDRSERLTIAAETMSDDDNVGSGLHSVDAGTSSGANDFKAKREVLALKTQLNAKKRELLGLRDELEARDRAILDAKHKNRELMAQLSDIEEKLLGAEEQLITAREEADAIKRDHATVTQREDGLKGRLSQAQDRISELERKLQEQAQSHQHAEEIEQALKASRHETAMERERADALGSELEATKARISELEHAVTEARQQAETGVAEVREQAKRDEEAALASLAQEHQAELQFEENRHREELRRLQERLERDLQQLREQVEQHRHELGQRRDAERRAQQALAVALRVLDEPQAAQ
jgi:chromosome segregation ATPase